MTFMFAFLLQCAAGDSNLDSDDFPTFISPSVVRLHSKSVATQPLYVSFEINKVARAILIPTRQYSSKSPTMEPVTLRFVPLALLP